MTKENFLIYDKTKDVYCECCKRYKSVSCFNYRHIKTNTRNATKCRVCEWIERHRDNILLLTKEYCYEDILEVISFLIEQKGEYVNTLSKIIDKSIIDTIDLIYKLNLKNIHISVMSNCEFCNKEIITTASVYKKNNFNYCSPECYYEDKTNKAQTGKNSVYYNRISTNCTNCNKEMEIIPSWYYQTNKFGDNHNFCSKQCYWEYRSKYYIKEKSSLYNYEYTEEQKENARIKLLNRLKNENRLDTKIQLIINNILEENNLIYEREKTFDFYSIDNYLIDYNLIIEVMGDYWHCNPNKYNEKNYLINEIQKNQLHRDKIKKSYIKNHFNINILYLWETDINSNQDLCKKLIMHYINNNGILENYNSFNWEIIDNELSLKDEIIIPYQNMSINEYRHLIKKKAG